MSRRAFGAFLLLLAGVVGSPTSLDALASSANGQLQLHFLNVGQGDAALLVSPGGQTVLIDNGVVNQCSRPVSYLRAQGVAGLEYHVASHYHADHIGCTPDVLAVMPLLGWAIDRGGSYPTQTYERYAAAVTGRRQVAPVGRSVALDGGVWLDFLAANGAGVPGASDENDFSVVLRVRYGQFDAVLAGDLSGISQAGYRDVESTVAAAVGPVEVYKVNHHASRYSSNATWLATTRPQVGIVSVGATNGFGHPTAEAMSRLHAANVRTFWTSVGNGVAPRAEYDVVAGDILVRVARAATTFEVHYDGQSQSFPIWATPAVVPGVPTNLAGSASGSTVNLVWTAPVTGGAPTGYVVEAAATAGGPTIATLNTTQTSLQVPSVPNGTYFVRVRALNADGASIPSNEVQVTVGAASCTAAPLAPTTLAGTVSGSVVSLQWTAASAGCGVTGYRVRAGSAAGLTNFTSFGVGTNRTFAGTAPAGTYYVTVVAENAFGLSAPSNEVIVNIAPSCIAPGTPTAFSANSTGTGAAFTWNAPATGGAPSGYLLEAGSSAGSANLAVVPIVGSSYQTPAPSGTYFVRVRAQNACGTGPASAEQTLVIGCAGPGTPATPAASTFGSTATLTWSGVSGATSYRLDVGSASGASNISSQTLSGTSQQLTGLAPGMYFARVTAVNGCGAGRASGETMFSIAGSGGGSRTCNGAAVPAVVDCGTPTARCNNGDYSCSQNRSGTCSRNGGVACWVCPGPLC